MEQHRFEALCEAYGGDIDRWPEAEREAARDFVADNPAIATLSLDAARALDQALAASVSEPPSEALYQRIVADGARARVAGRPSWAAAAAAIMLTLGMGAGWVVAPTAETSTEDVYASAFGAFEDTDALSLEEDA